MDSNKISNDESIEIIINGTKYVLVHPCAFHEVNPDDVLKRIDTVKNEFGLHDLYTTFNIYQIHDEKKWMLAKLKLEL